MLKNEITQTLGAMERRFDQKNVELEYVPVTNYASQVVRRQQGSRKIAIWSAAVDAALAETGSVYFPASAEAYYIDRPIILDSGMRMEGGHRGMRRLASDGRKAGHPVTSTSRISAVADRASRWPPSPSPFLPLLRLATLLNLTPTSIAWAKT